MNATLFQAIPIIVLLLVATLVGFGVYLTRDTSLGAMQPVIGKFTERLDRANIKMRSEEVAIGIFVSSAIIWALIVFFVRPEGIIALISLPLILLIEFKMFEQWVNIRISQRLTAFNSQLELVLRMMSSAIRAGLGLRQALIMVTEEMPDPARHEFHLTVMQTNIGMSTNDALTRLAMRMPSAELQMMTRAIAVQTQTGGNLGKTLDHLAATIKDRRKLFRKVKTLTSEARGSAIVIGALPLILAAVIMSSQPEMRDALLTTSRGHIAIALAASLWGGGVFSLIRLMDFKV